ncbi:MAG: hypothetical protein ACRD2R_05290, partial [Terriglobales bacterium]
MSQSSPLSCVTFSRRLWLGVALLLAWAGAAAAQEGIGEVFAADATVRGSVMLVGGGTRVLSGSSVTAGSAAAVLRLNRGGKVRVCPGTRVTITASNSGRELLWGVDTGAIELHYDLTARADTLMTPDFRVLLAGPGSFHLAIRSDARGNTCVRALKSNSAAVIVSELMGNGTYQVKADEEVVFHGGRVGSNSSLAPPDCGCPAPAPALLAEKAATPVPQAAAAEKVAGDSDAMPKLPAVAPAVRETPPAAALEPKPGPRLPSSANPMNWGVLEKQRDVTAPPPEVESGAIHIQVDAPFVYQAREPAPEAPPVVARLRLSPWPQVPAAERAVLP